jgi:ABC-type branched-subunit amino acid transport system ATPase component
MNMLTVTDLTRAYGGVRAVDGVSFECAEGKITGIIGPNGAGKSTLVNLITGLDRPQAGEVLLAETRITRLPAHRIARLGVARTFQNLRLFKNLTVRENAAAAMPKGGKAKVNQWLEVFRLTELAQRNAGSIPYGAARRLEMARAMVTGPKLIFLDEPAAGMNPEETAELVDQIKLINRDYGTTVVVIEHDMSLIRSLCDQVLVMNTGKKLCFGSPAEVLADPRVIEIYLGKEEEAYA